VKNLAISDFIKLGEVAIAGGLVLGLTSVFLDGKTPKESLTFEKTKVKSLSEML
jgi:hypothetical protein